MKKIKRIDSTQAPSRNNDQYLKQIVPKLYGKIAPLPANVIEPPNKIEEHWYEAINMVAPTLVDPNVAQLYKWCLGKSETLLVPRTDLIKWNVKALMRKYNEIAP